MKIIEVNHTRLAYTQEGQGEAVLLIHGLGASAWTWKHQKEVLLQNNYQVILPDLRGHGMSHKPNTPYNINTFTEDLSQLIKTLDLGKVHLVGLSMGGVIAFDLAATQPTLVKSLLISNTGPEFKTSLLEAMVFYWEREFCLSHYGIQQLQLKHSKL